MNESRILIIGAYGQLGKALQAKYPKAKAVDRDNFDMTDWDMLSKYDWSKVDMILNAAVFANVDGAETPEGREAAWQVNAVGPSYLSKIATEHDITLVHVSSDYVFDGTKAPHKETENYTPLGVYGQSKAAGDIAAAMTPKHYILRTSWLVGDGKNFVRSIVGLAERDIEPSVVGDQFGRLTFTTELVRALDHLLAKQAPFGTYNLSNDGDIVSWADFAREIYKQLKPKLKVTDTTAAEYFAGKISSPRPTQSGLDLTKIKKTGFAPHDWRKDLHDYIEAEQAKPKE